MRTQPFPALLPFPSWCRGKGSTEMPWLPLPIMVSHKLMMKYEDFRKENSNLYFPDAKSQVSVIYEDNKPVAFDTTT